MKAQQTNICSVASHSTGRDRTVYTRCPATELTIETPKEGRWLSEYGLLSACLQRCPKKCNASKPKVCSKKRECVAIFLTAYQPTCGSPARMLACKPLA
eukprot:1753495-Amphidinium_carterae.1